MPVTFAELFILCLLAWALYRLLRPVQRHMERVLLKWMGRESGRPGQGFVYVMPRKPQKQQKDRTNEKE